MTSYFPTKFQSARAEAVAVSALDAADDFGGNVEAPTGAYARVSYPNVDDVARWLTDDAREVATEYGVADSELVGHWLTVEDSNGFVTVLRYDSLAELLDIYGKLEAEFDRWDSTADDIDPDYRPDFFTGRTGYNG